jgi:lysophospholipase L1-like esterase
MQIPVVGLVGDSRMFGFADTFAGYLGYAARALRVAKIPFLQLSGDSEQMANVGGSSGQLQFRVRRNLLNLCTHVVVEYSTNDIYIQGASFATLKSYAQSTWQQFYNRGLKVFAETGQPQTTGTWTTAAGQTPTATGSGSTTAQAWNAYLRTWTPNTTDPALSLLSGVIDVAAMSEVNASNVFTIGGGRWYCGPGNNTAYTNDGIHLNGTGNAYVAPFYPASAFYLGINGNTGEFAAPFNPLGGA